MPQETHSTMSYTFMLVLISKQTISKKIKIQNSNQRKYPLTEKWTNKLWYIPRMQYYTVVNMSELEPQSYTQQS